MKYLLDSNACIVFLNKRSDKLKQRLELCQPRQIVLCSVVKAELFYGAMKSQNPTASLAKAENFCAHFQSLPFDDNAALVYGKVRAELSAKGQPIGANDFMIAAIALANKVTLITHNTREFSRVSELLWKIGSYKNNRHYQITLYLTASNPCGIPDKGFNTIFPSVISSGT